MSAGGTELTTAELRNLRRLAGFMIPADAGHGVPGADDEIIFADIVRSLDRDLQAIRAGSATLRSPLIPYLRPATGLPEKVSTTKVPIQHCLPLAWKQNMRRESRKNIPNGARTNLTLSS